MNRLNTPDQTDLAELNRDALLEKYSRTVDSALRTLDEEVIFVFHYVDSDFYSKATFSNLKFSLRVYTAGGTKAAVRPSTLFTVTPPSEDQRVPQLLPLTAMATIPKAVQTERKRCNGRASVSNLPALRQGSCFGKKVLWASSGQTTTWCVRC